MGNSVQLTLKGQIIAPSNMKVQVIKVENLDHIEIPGKFVSTVCCRIDNPTCEENTQLIQIGQEMKLSFSPITKSLYCHPINVYNWLAKNYLVLEEGSWTKSELDMFVMIHGQVKFDSIKWLYQNGGSENLEYSKCK